MRKTGIVGVLMCLFLAWASLAWSQTANWPNEPAGSTLVTDWGFSTLTGSGWNDAYPGSNATIVSNQNGPVSAPSALQMLYPKGMTAGIGPGNIYYSINQLREIYLGFWWKPSDPWQSEDNSGVNKVIFLQTNTKSLIMCMFGHTGGPYNLYAELDFGTSNGHLPSSRGDDPGMRICMGNVNPIPVTLGQWHRIEVYVKHSTTTSSKDGIVRWWMDGTMIGNHINANFPADNWSQMAIAPTWGGMNNTKTQTDYFWYDHFRISKPNGAPSIMMISTASLPTAASGRAYSATLLAEGGKAPYNWTITSGSLLPGLSLSKTTGVISGTPTTGGKCSFTVKAQDANVPPTEVSKSFSIVASGTSLVRNGNRLSVVGSQFSVETKTMGMLFRIPQAGAYRLGVYDLSGKQICASSGVASGKIEIEKKPKNGNYLARLNQQGKSEVVRFQVME